MSNFRIKCPYCDEYNEYNFKICKQYSNYRKVKCDKCNLQFEINVYCEVSCSADSEELKELNPRFVDRKEFKIVSPSGNILKIWNRR